MRIRLRRDLRHGLVVTMAAYLAFAGGYVFHIISSRWLGPTDYATVGTVASLLNMVTMALGAVEMAGARVLASVCSRFPQGSVLPTSALIWRRSVLAISVGLGGSLVAANSPLSSVLHLQSPLPVLIVAASVPFMGLATWHRITLRTQDLFDQIAVRIVVEKALLIGVMLVALVAGAGSAGVVLASCSGWVAWLWWRPRSLAGSRPDARPALAERSASTREEALTLMLIYVLMGVTGNIDVLIVQSRFGAEAAGPYSVAALFGRALFLGVLSLAGVLIPKAATQRPGTDLSLLGHYMVVSLTLCVAGIAMASTLGSVLLGTVFGDAFRSAAPLLALQMGYAALAGLQGLTSCFAHARRIHGALQVQLLGVTAAVLPLVLLDTIPGMLRVSIIGQLACLIGSCVWVIAAEKQRLATGSLHAAMTTVE